MLFLPLSGVEFVCVVSPCEGVSCSVVGDRPRVSYRQFGIRRWTQGKQFSALSAAEAYVSDLAATRFPTLPLSEEIADQISISTGQQLPQEEVSDEALVANSCAGHRDALALLFRRYARLVRSVGLRILRDEGEADDVVQEVFLYIHKRSGVFDGAKGSARSWIVQIAYTQALLRKRHLKVRRFYSSLNIEEIDVTDVGAQAGSGYQQTPEGVFGRNGWKEIEGVLTSDQRETVRLHFFEGYTLEEISMKLKQSHGNVRHHYYRSLEKLRGRLSRSELSAR
jgi:RNA polymerase sigma-70 factor (ECF subfamily)